MGHIEEITRFTERYAKIPGVIGIFWGGSSQGRAPEEHSDVDLFVVTDDSVAREKGLYERDNVVVDYFVNPLSRIERQMREEVEVIHDHWAVKIYAFSKPLYDADGCAEKLQKLALSLYEKPFPLPDVKTNMTNHYSVYDSYQELLKLYGMGLQWRPAYYACLGLILHAVCYREGVPLVPFLKAQRLMTDGEYLERYRLKALPSEEFRVMFLECLRELPAEELMDNIKIMYEWCMGGSAFDPAAFHLYR